MYCMGDLKFPVLFFLFSISFVSIYADAYLAEDSIYYGADTYTLDYAKKVIRAEGKAFFERGNWRVSARRIIINYAEGVKKAFCYGNVLVRNRATGSELRGNYGEAHFKDDYYMIEGNALYKDELRSVRANKIESKSFKHFICSDNVEYLDNEVEVHSRFLEIDENGTASFREMVSARFIKTGDEIYSESIRYFSGSGDAEFVGDVLFIQADSPSRTESSLISRSEALRYLRDEDCFLLLNEVYIMNRKYSFSGSVVRFYRDRNLLESTGETVVWEVGKAIYCNGMLFNINTGEVLFSGSVRGVVDVSSK